MWRTPFYYLAPWRRVVVCLVNTKCIALCIKLCMVA